MELEASKTYATDRGYEDWTSKDDPELSRYLLLAQDYLDLRYNLKSELKPAEQAKLDVAHFKIAYDILKNGEAATREARTPVKEVKEGAGFKKEVQYADTSTDPYPGITALLQPLMIASAPSGVTFGRLVR